jgi:hypothetical protein
MLQSQQVIEGLSQSKVIREHRQLGQDNKGQHRHRSHSGPRGHTERSGEVVSTSHRAVTTEEAKELVSRLNISVYQECSAKNNEGVQEVFQSIAKEIAEKGVPKSRHTLTANKADGSFKAPIEIKPSSALGKTEEKKQAQKKNCNC